MINLQDVSREISDRPDAVVEAFQAATDRPPWLPLPPGERISYLEHLIVPLTRGALTDERQGEGYRRMLHIAARHGEDRFHQGLPDHIIFDDFLALGRALFSCLDFRFDPPVHAVAASRIGRHLSVASGASLRGYYRDSFEREEKWPDVIEDLCVGDGSTGRDASDDSTDRGAADPGDCGADDRERLMMDATSLMEGFIADAREWIAGVRDKRPDPGDRPPAPLTIGLLNEYSGALDVLEVIRQIVDSYGTYSRGGVKRGNEVLAVISAEGLVEFASPQTGLNLGWEPNGARGTDLLGFVHPEDQGELRAVLQLVPYPHPVPLRTRFRIRHVEGSWCTLEVTIRPLLLGTSAPRFVLRGRVLHVSFGESVVAGLKGEYFKRYLPR